MQHSHVHLQVDAGLMEQLKAGHAALLEKQARPALPPVGGASIEATPSIEKARAGQAEGEGSKNIETPENGGGSIEILHIPEIREVT